MKQGVYITSKYKKGTAFLLCLVGGMIGLHYFYVGRTFRGIIAAFTCNFFLVGWFLDLGTIIQGRFRDQYGDYLK